ncbi:u3 small nucleolar RNA-associated protein 6 domain-containing protein [Sarocladium implicatum]|nr:u3 small nucleolar RNA-associated protein 6 domain-containing protein [Sarocladium implicatum]
MAGVADKARLHLERSVPQLREWEERGIFTKDEIRNMVKKRDDFEHRVLNPSNRPVDWAAYVQWEQSLEALRSKRCKRLKINQHLSSNISSQGRIMQIYDRAVNRHPGSSTLWHDYLAYLANVKASKRFRNTMTNALRMMPNNVALWKMAGKRSAEAGDMAAARGFFLRGCRFCNKDAGLWIEYARCEMEWLLKVQEDAKKNPPKSKIASDAQNELRLVGLSDDEDEEEGDVVMPKPSADEPKVIDTQSAKQLLSGPAMDGAIPMAVFDVCRKQSFFTPASASTFFDMFTSYRSLDVQPRITAHVLAAMDLHYPEDPHTCDCHVREPLVALDPYTAEFPKRLRGVLATLREKLETTTDKEALQGLAVKWIDRYLEMKSLDTAIQTVLQETKRQMLES